MRWFYWIRLYVLPFGLNQGQWNMRHSRYLQMKDPR